MHATKIYKMTDNYSTMASEDEIYCTICGAGFTQVRALEFHQSAHDVRFMPSELDRLAQLTKDYDNRGENSSDQDIQSPQAGQPGDCT